MMRGKLDRQAIIACRPIDVVMVGLLSFICLLTSATAQTGRGGTLRIGMTAADIAYTAGQPDQGFEGFRFVGYPLYDALVRRDLSQGDRLPDIVPSLAESWESERLRTTAVVLCGSNLAVGRAINRAKC